MSIGTAGAKNLERSKKRYFFQGFGGGDWPSRPLATRLIGDPLYLNIRLGMSKTNKKERKIQILRF